MWTRASHRRVWTSDLAWFRRCAPLWLLVAVLSSLLAMSLGSVTGSTRTLAAEEESGESPTEEDVESLSYSLNRDDLLEGQIPPAVKSHVAVPRRACTRLSRPAPRPTEFAARNGCGGPLRC